MDVNIVNVLWLLLMVAWVGLQCMIVVFPDPTHLCIAGLDQKPHISSLFAYRRY